MRKNIEALPTDDLLKLAPSRPWHHGVKSGTKKPSGGIGNGMEHIARFNDGFGEAQMIHAAELTRRAVNSFEAMREALKATELAALDLMDRAARIDRMLHEARGIEQE